MNKLFSALAVATGLSTGVAAQADDIVFAAYPGVAPYIIQTETGPKGIEIDIVSAAMREMGHDVTFVTLPFGRAVVQFEQGLVDAALTISPAADLDLGEAYYSDNHITFENVAISLAERGLEIPDIAALGSYSVASFEFAKEYLGSEFADMANANPNYREMIPDTRPLPPTLFAGRSDVAVIEINIFRYHLQNEEYTVPTDKPITIHRVFPTNPFAVVFRDAALRDQFNEGLARIRESGRYAEVFETYIGVGNATDLPE